MFIINTYKDYCLAIANKESDDPVKRNDAKKALGILKLTDRERYDSYLRTFENWPTLEEIRYLEEYMLKLEEQDIAKYIKRHPDLDVEQIRIEARSRLIKGRNGFGGILGFPAWITKEDMLLSVERLAISDLITSRGKLARREIIMQKCIKKAVEERRVDEDKLRQLVLSWFDREYRAQNIFFIAPNLYEPVRRMILKKSTMEELAEIELAVFQKEEMMVQLINEKKLKGLSEKEMIALEERKKKKKEKAEKRKRRENYQRFRDELNSDNAH